MKERIEELSLSFTEALGKATGEEELEALRIAYLGKKGYIASLMQSLRDVADKKAAGQMINSFKVSVEEKLTAASEALKAAAIEAQIRSAKKYNPTLDYKKEFGS